MTIKQQWAKIWFIATLFLSNSAYAESGYDPEKARAQIRESSQVWATVLVTGDTSPLEELLSDDMVGTAPNGRLYTKRDFIDYTKANPPGLISNKVNDVRIRFFGNVAVAQGNETLVFKSGETKRSVWTDIYERRRNKWVIVAAQDVLVDETSVAPKENLFE